MSNYDPPRFLRLRRFIASVVTRGHPCHTCGKSCPGKGCPHFFECGDTYDWEIKYPLRYRILHWTVYGG